MKTRRNIKLALAALALCVPLVQGCSVVQGAGKTISGVSTIAMAPLQLAKKTGDMLAGDD